MYILTTYHIGDGLAVRRIEDKDAAIADIWSTMQRYSDGAITNKSNLHQWLSDAKERINQLQFCDDLMNSLSNQSSTNTEHIDIKAQTDNHGRLALCVQFKSGHIDGAPDIIYRARLENVHFAGSMLYMTGR